MVESVYADQSFSRERPEIVTVQIKVGDVSIDGVGNASPIDSGGDKGVVRENPGSVSNFTCGLFDVVELNHLSFCEPFLEFSNHCEFGAQDDGVDCAVGLGKHKGGTDKVIGVGGNDVSGIHNALVLNVKQSLFN